MKHFRFLLFSLYFLISLSYLCYTGDRISSSHFEISYEGFNRNYAENTLKISETCFLKISRAIGHKPEKPISIILANSDDHFRQLTRGAIPEWSAAVALDANRIIITPLPGRKHTIDRILAHEIVHCIINDATGDMYVPRWFHEGCAQHLSGEWGIRNRLYMAWNAIRNDLLTFQDIQTMFSSRSADVSLAYDQSMLAVRHLIHRSGSNVLPNIINGLKNGDDFSTAFWEATGLWPSEFEEEYLDYIRRTYGKRTLYALLPGTWTLILVLAAIVYFIKRRRTRRLIRQWEIIESAEKIIHFEDIDRGY